MTAPGIGALARSLDEGSLTALGLAESALARIDADNARDRIFISVQREAALSAARQSNERRAARRHSRRRQG